MIHDPARLDAVFFDLDDTLADTAGTLVPAALARAARAMVGESWAVDEACLHDFLTRRAAEGRGGDYFADALAHFGGANGRGPALAAAGRSAFLRGDVRALRLLPGARRLLELLAPLPRFLVTAGDPDTQRAKLDRLALTNSFHDVRFVNTLAGEDKETSIRALVAEHGLDPHRCLCVGDRVIGEIRIGNRLGMTTVWMRRGEFRQMEPRDEDERPDHVVDSPETLADLLEGPAT